MDEQRKSFIRSIDESVADVTDEDILANCREMDEDTARFVYESTIQSNSVNHKGITARYQERYEQVKYNKDVLEALGYDELKVEIYAWHLVYRDRARERQ